MSTLSAQLYSQIILVWFLFASFLPLTAQQTYEVMNYQVRSQNEVIANANDSSRFHMNTAFHPAISNAGEGRIPYKTYIPLNKTDSSFLLNQRYRNRSWFMRKLTIENFIIVDTGKFYLTIDPLMNVAVGRDNYSYQSSSVTPGKKGDKIIFNNSRGLILKADIGSKVAVESYVVENQSYLPNYLDTFVDYHGVVPGQGRVKRFRTSGYDYSQSGGYVSYAPFKSFNLQLGHHKHFIGYGYRSLLLSDNTFNYPFLRMNAQFWRNRISYAVMYTSFQNLNRLPTGTGSESPFERKGGTYHFLEVNVTKRLKFSIYQGMIWQTMDSTGAGKTDYNMYNPIMFVNPAISGLDGKNNAILGAGFKYIPIDRASVYGMVVADDGNFKKYGLQAGMSYFLLKTLRLQVEWNKVAPNTYYSSALSGRQSFSHYNQSLAHPLGAGFTEVVGKLNFRFSRWLIDLQVNKATFDRAGQFVFEDASVTKASPQNYYIRKDLLWSRLEVAYLLNPATNLKIFANYTIRNEDKNRMDANTVSSTMYYFGIRTDLHNFYYDF